MRYKSEKRAIGLERTGERAKEENHTGEEERVEKASVIVQARIAEREERRRGGHSRAEAMERSLKAFGASSRSLLRGLGGAFGVVAAGLNRGASQVSISY